MSDFPPLHQAIIVRISLQGGVAFLPGLSRPRPIDLASCPEAERDEILQILQASVRQASDHCGHGDQRYFRVELVYRDGTAERSTIFQVPEEDAPDPLVGLWRRNAR